MVKISSFGSFAVRKKGRRIGRNPKTGNGSADQPAARPGVPRLACAEGPDQRCAQRKPGARRSGAVMRLPDLFDQQPSPPGPASRRQREVRRGFPHHQRSGRRARSAAARAALLGVEIPADQAAEARAAGGAITGRTMSRCCGASGSASTIRATPSRACRSCCARARLRWALRRAGRRRPRRAPRRSRRSPTTCARPLVELRNELVALRETLEKARR